MEFRFLAVNGAMGVMKTMKNLQWLAAAILLSGCAGDSDVERAGKFLVGTFNGSGEKISRERAAAVPYATMGLALGSNPEVLLVLGTATGGNQEWFAGDAIFVATRDGHIIRTAGLPYDLGGIRSLSSASNVPSAAAPSLFLVDFPDLGVYAAPLLCSSKLVGDDTIEILGASIPTRHIVEQCQVSALKWTFENDFWQDVQTGAMWRSSQYVHPKSPPVILEVLRPAEAGGG
jgi:hypothetical protein